MSAHASLGVRPAPPKAEASVRPTPWGPSLRRRCACGGTPGPSGECAACRARRLARSPATPEARKTVPAIVHEVLRSPGRPLSAATRAVMEPRLGHDFGRVRVHVDDRADASARAVNALAYTVGHHVVFGAGQYVPGTAAGRRLLAHELTHVAQQPDVAGPGPLALDGPEPDRFEVEARQAEQRIDAPATRPAPGRGAPALVRRAVRPENVTCHDTGLTNPDLTGAEAVAAIQAADADAIVLALRAELLLESNLLFAEAGDPVDAAFDTILQEELGLSLTNPAQRRLIRQQVDRFQRVRETLESGYLRYMCRGGDVKLVGCQQGSCEAGDFAFACEGNRLVVLCQEFWDNPGQRDATLVHEPFHILFSMAHRAGVPRRSDADCFESFALRVAGRAASVSCAGRTAG